jgi:hypothetical protein
MTKRARKSDYEINNSILIAGQLASLACRLNTIALEKFLAAPPKDFRYEKLCRAAIAFRKAVHG